MGNNIRIKRALQNISQWEVAKLTGLPQSRISLIENDLVIPKFKELKKLADVLDTTVDALLESRATGKPYADSR